MLLLNKIKIIKYIFKTKHINLANLYFKNLKKKKKKKKKKITHKILT